MAEQAPEKSSKKPSEKAPDDKKSDCSDDEKKEVELDLPAEILDKIKKTGVTKKQLCAMNRLELRLFCLNECGLTMKEFQTVFELIKELIGGFTVTNSKPYYIYFRKENTWLGYDTEKVSEKNNEWIYGKNIFDVDKNSDFQWGCVASGDQYEICHWNDQKKFIVAKETSCELVEEWFEESFHSSATVFTEETGDHTDLIKFKFHPTPESPAKWLCLLDGKFQPTAKTETKTRKLRFSLSKVQRCRIRFRETGLYLRLNQGVLDAASSVGAGAEAMFEWHVIEEHNKRSVANKQDGVYHFITLDGLEMRSFAEAPCKETRLCFEKSEELGCCLWVVNVDQVPFYLRCTANPASVSESSTTDAYRFFDLEPL